MSGINEIAVGNICPACAVDMEQGYMCEILFHGKRRDNGEWVEGHLITGRWYLNELEIVAIVPLDNAFYSHCEISEWYEVDPATVGQYTGLPDKNGKKIFEGDIGSYRQTDGAKRNGDPILCTGKVVYNTKTASYAVDSRDDAGCKYFDYFPIKDFEVIGNIHDNPELLEEK